MRAYLCVLEVAVSARHKTALTADNIGRRSRHNVIVDRRLCVMSLTTPTFCNRKREEARARVAGIEAQPMHIHVSSV